MSNHGVTPEPPEGSEHYREGWRNGYEQAQIELDRLRAIEQRAREVFDNGPGRLTARYILGES